MNAPVWQSQCQQQETVADAAARFVLETFGEEQPISWGTEPGEFKFPDGYWCYRVAFNGGHWQVFRMAKMTPRAKARVKARREARL